VLGAVPVVPVTVTVNALAALQLTDKTLPETVEVQPAGGVLVTASETLPVNPLIAVTEIVEEPGVLTVVLIEAGAEDKEKSWTVTRTPTVRVIEPLAPCTVTVNGVTPVEQVTDKRPAALTVAAQPPG
jgi:hypothetical protein